MMACQSSEKSDNTSDTPPPQPPVAEAGSNQNVSEGSIVTLDGSGSTDPDGSIVTYLWEQTGGTTVSFTSSATQATFTAPESTGSPEALTFLLTVTDNSGFTATDTVTITVYAQGLNLPPVAEAGNDQTVNHTTQVTLDGSGSTDSDGTIVSYLWEQTGGTSVDFTPSAIQPSFTAPEPSGASEALTFQLTVTDDDGDTGTDTVTVTIMNANFSDDFSSDTRDDYTVTHTCTEGGQCQFLYDDENERLQVLTGDNVALRFDRTLPSSSQVGIFQMDLLPTATYPLGGRTTIFLMEDEQNYYEIVNSDGYGPETVSKVVNGVVVDSASFTLEYDQNTPYHLTLAFTPYSLVVEAFGERVTLSADSTAIWVGEFGVRLAQQDAYIDNFSFTNEISDLVPIAEAGDNETYSEGDLVTLDGSGSVDMDGTIVDYHWAQTGGTSVSFDAAAIQPTFTAPDITGSLETLTFLLTVTDDSGFTDSDTVSVTVISEGSSAFSDDFSTDTRSDYVVTHVWTDGGQGEFLYDATGDRLQVVTGDNVALRFDHASPATLDTGVLQMAFLPTTMYPNGGQITIWLYQDEDNYYEIINTDGYGPGTIRKVVGGLEVDSASFDHDYTQNTTYNMVITFTPDILKVEAFGDTVTLTADSTAIQVGEFRVQLNQQDAYFDNFVFSDDISSLNYNPVARFQSEIDQPLTVVFDASASYDSDGSIVHYAWNFGDGETGESEVTSHAYASAGTYSVGLTVTDNDGATCSFTMDINNNADYYVAIGNSITRGSQDDISSDGIGYEPVLATLLDTHQSYTNTVVNEGVSGLTSADGADLVPTTLNDHPDARYYLIMYGTNDAGIAVADGLGLLPGDTGYDGSFKDNMQTIISAIVARGKIPYLAKIPYATGAHSGLNSYIESYNNVVDELAVENDIDVIPPDFYCLFQTYPERLADGLHPDGEGYQLMAQWWFDALTGVAHEECE